MPTKMSEKSDNEIDTDVWTGLNETDYYIFMVVIKKHKSLMYDGCWVDPTNSILTLKLFSDSTVQNQSSTRTIGAESGKIGINKKYQYNIKKRFIFQLKTCSTCQGTNTKRTTEIVYSE